jgi:hypothetical protein
LVLELASYIKLQNSEYQIVHIDQSRFVFKS